MGEIPTLFVPLERVNLNHWNIIVRTLQNLKVFPFMVADGGGEDSSQGIRHPLEFFLKTRN
jgi:hypothetical protein